MNRRSELPVIDLDGNLAAPIGPRLSDLAAAVREACTGTGFFYLEGHGIDTEVIEGAFQANRRFHSLPLESKMALASNQWHRGYLGFGAAKLKSSARYAPARHPNRMESFFIRHEVAADDPEFMTSKPLQGPNQWPDDPAFRAEVTRYDDAVRELGMGLLPVLSLAVGEEADFLAQFFAPASTALRLNHYPPTDPALGAEVFGSNPHTDYGFITLLVQDAVGGLEVEGENGAWFPVPYRQGAFVVNIGDIFARWTNDTFKSTPHRVVNESMQLDRYSLAYFFDPNLDALIDCLPAFRRGGSPRYEPIPFGDYFAGRLDANYERTGPGPSVNEARNG